MTRSSAFFSAVLLSGCLAFAQTPAPAQLQPAITSTDSPEVHQFQVIEDNWSESVNQHDQYGLELVLSPLFVDISAAGDITTRNQQLSQVISAQDKGVKLEQRVITVRLLGDIAVANGTYSLRYKVNSNPVVEKGVFTHVFQRLRGGWVCVNSQRTVLREDTNVKTAKAKKQSDAELPFHIPLFTKSEKGPQTAQ